jgi:hypothetical protein
MMLSPLLVLPDRLERRPIACVDPHATAPVSAQGFLLDESAIFVDPVPFEVPGYVANELSVDVEASNALEFVPNDGLTFTSSEAISDDKDYSKAEGEDDKKDDGCLRHDIVTSLGCTVSASLSGSSPWGRNPNCSLPSSQWTA